MDSKCINCMDYNNCNFSTKGSKFGCSFYKEGNAIKKETGTFEIGYVPEKQLTSCLICGEPTDFKPYMKGIAICDKCKDAVMQVRKLRENQTHNIEVYKEDGTFLYSTFPMTKEQTEIYIKEVLKMAHPNFTFKIVKYKGDINFN